MTGLLVLGFNILWTIVARFVSLRGLDMFAVGKPHGSLKPFFRQQRRVSEH